MSGESDDIRSISNDSDGPPLGVPPLMSVLFRKCVPSPSTSDVAWMVRYEFDVGPGGSCIETFSEPCSVGRRWFVNLGLDPLCGGLGGQFGCREVVDFSSGGSEGSPV